MTGVGFRTATVTEIAQMLDWAAQEGWNPGIDDAQAFHAADPDGFFVAEHDGQPIAAISVVNHSDRFAFLGLYLCRPDYRGMGIGFALWQHALKHAGNRCIGLDGVPAQQANYALSGFVRTGFTQRFCGTLQPAPLELPLATAQDFDALHRLDVMANGVGRPRFLRAWTQVSHSRKTVLLKRGAAITGFATARACRTGCKIGPIVASNARDALYLAGQAAASLQAGSVIIDVPDPSITFARMLADQGFTETFRTARMYLGDAPTPASTLMAVATLELG